MPFSPAGAHAESCKGFFIFPPTYRRTNQGGMKQLMAGGGVSLIGITLIPLLSGLFG